MNENSRLPVLRNPPLPARQNARQPAIWQEAAPVVARGAALVAAGLIGEWLLRSLARNAFSAPRNGQEQTPQDYGAGPAAIRGNVPGRDHRQRDGDYDAQGDRPPLDAPYQTSFGHENGPAAGVKRAGTSRSHPARINHLAIRDPIGPRPSREKGRPADGGASAGLKPLRGLRGLLLRLWHYSTARPGTRATAKGPIIARPLDL